jgi:uncharacterized membrane protein
MFYNLLKLSHVLTIVVWIGGMVFVHFFLRPAANTILASPERVRLLHGVLGRFFQALLVLATWAMLSGSWMIGQAAKGAVQGGGEFQMPIDWMVMAGLGVLMWVIFGHIRFALYKRLNRAVNGGDWATGSAILVQIKNWVTVNLCAGLLIITVVYLI